MAIKPVYPDHGEETARHGPHSGDYTLPIPEKPHDHLPAPTPASISETMCPTPDLPHISRLLRMQEYQKRRLCQLEAELRALQLSTARAARLAKIARSVHRTLAECVRSEDRLSFTSIFGALQDAADGSTVRVGMDATATDEAPFLNGLRDNHRDAVVKLLHQVRTNGDFLADRLASLTSREILALLPDRGSTRSSGSVLETSGGSYLRSSRHLGYVADRQTDSLSALSFGSTLETLVHAVGAYSSSSGGENIRCLDVWSTVCARLISERKSGSEKFVPAVLDLWAEADAWPGKQRLEIWMRRTLQRGSFLLDQPSKQSFRMRIQVRPELPRPEDTQAEAFYDEAVSQLLDLVADSSGATLIPESALSMFRAIWRKLPPESGHQRGLSRFILTRWLFSSFIMDVLSLPEAYNMMPDYYISDNARSRILREIANRAQKAVFDVTYAWKHGHPVSLETAARVDSLLSRLQGGCQQIAAPQDISAHGSPLPKQAAFLVLSAADVTAILLALYPQRRPASFSSDQSTMHSGLQSSASSISGFSLFSPSVVSEGPASGLQWTGKETLGEPFVGTGLTSTNGFVPGREQFDSFSLDPDLVGEILTSIEETIGPGGRPTSSWAVHLLQEGNSSEPEIAQYGRGNSQLTTGPDDHEYFDHDVLYYLLAVIPASKSPRQAGCDMSAFDIYQHLLLAMETAYRTAEQARDYLEAHYWMEQLDVFRNAFADGLQSHRLTAMLDRIEVGTQAGITTDEVSVDSCIAWQRLATQTLEAQTSELVVSTRAAHHLRDKMWFVADVRTSAPYDEARSVANALRTMENKKRNMRAKVVPPLRHWTNAKVPSANFHLKTDAQVLELLSASSEQGGSGKLSDDQARATQLWLDQNNIEVICPAEERLHRLCMEIRKCVEILTSADGALLSSNSLFARDARRHVVHRNPLAALQATTSRFSCLQLRTDVAPSIDTVSSASHPLSSASSREYLQSRSPTLTHRSSAPFWSPTMTEARSPSSATSLGSYHTRNKSYRASKRNVRAVSGIEDCGTLEELRRSLTALLLSDLTPLLFNDGSETDRAFWTGLGSKVTEQHLRSMYSQSGLFSRQSPSPASLFSFDYMVAFERLFESFSAFSDPTTKLSLLYDIDQLLPLYANSLTIDASRDGRSVQSSSRPDASIEGFRKLFCNAALRPKAIFRDLQYIAALVPSHILESTPAGKAFCNAAVAITGLKQELRNLMVETADSIIAYHSNNRGHGRASSTAQQERDSATFSAPNRVPSAEDVARYGMEHAAELLQITAKEGDPVAQRELATLYLTHPELMDHIIAPFSRPRDVFKDELESKWRKNQDPNRCDPATMCVANHWMGLSSKGGDALAKEYLRQRDEMERLP
ncbi:hypothetical protein LTR97_009303 [Elasticomyces elasticus]|uniref:Uncharacterized protein n=1 Tax=Elasticomyces elasticus TaxID=574655 RepID=A0AAN7ZM36_9PEZI|nr:hypothetical protein LTR97_009303 [Elasticomyces elasticus]KAK5728456.1 hypothetical protein LTR15_001592 [Elasticomyces elasticus]